MRRSSQLGFGASVGVAIFSASFAADFSSDQSRLFFWSRASANIPAIAAPIVDPIKTSAWSDPRARPGKIRRRALLSNVQQKLSRRLEAVDPILP